MGQFNSKHTGLLDRIATDYPADLALLVHLTQFAKHAEELAQTAATALLKRSLLAGFTAPADLVARWLDLLVAVSGWESKLHLLQAMPMLDIPDEQADGLYGHLISLLDERNKFIRAWTYSALHRFTSLHAGYRPQVRNLLDRAGQEDAASVRARLRRLPPLDP